MSVQAFDLLTEMRANMGASETTGLDDATVQRFLAVDDDLNTAVRWAHAEWLTLRGDAPELMALDEAALRRTLQADYVNFYEDDAVNPYVPLAAKGTWIVTAFGAVIHDNGGYGMLGFGHAEPHIQEALARPQVMANVMTASFAQGRFGAALRAELGHTRGVCPFDRFLCLNSGSEAVTLAARIADVHCATQTGPGGRHAGAKPKYLVLSGSFHGRTTQPGRASDSTAAVYGKHLASHKDRDDVVVVPSNDVAALRAAFADAEASHVFLQLMFMEPVQGEGSPGTAATREFYDAARALTKAHGGLLLVDSIQAGLRASGTLSIVDYPGFEDCEAPDMETWSKALNGGQYPLSVLGCNARAAAIYQKGVYGNTMTTNPRALDGATAVLGLITPALRENIRARGLQLVAGLKALQADMPGLITSVKGTGLLCSAELNAAIVGHVVGVEGVETACRKVGMGLIHGGKNALRFTPHFYINEDEVKLILDVVRGVLTDAAAASAVAVTEPLSAPA